MPGRTLALAATNLLARGYLVVPTDRKAVDGSPVNALFAVARSIHRALTFKTPTSAIAVIESDEATRAKWPDILRAQMATLPALLRTLGLTVVDARGEEHAVASYARRALDGGDDVIIVGVDKRFAQLVSDRLWWYDANKDVRYTNEIVEKRFGVAAPHVGEWLALVGDDSGNEVLPGVKGIGAKGATSIIEEYGSIGAALERAEGRLAKALAAARDEIPRELARGKLDQARALPAKEIPPYTPPVVKELNALYERLGFVELLVAEAGGSSRVEICETKSDIDAALARLERPVAIHVLLEDPSPVRALSVGELRPPTPPRDSSGHSALRAPRPSIAGIALADGTGNAFYVTAWRELASWLEDTAQEKTGHDLVEASVELRRAGITLRGIVGDSAVASHLTESSNWAPHDLTVIAKHALGRALPEDDAVLGVGKQRKSWKTLPLTRVAEHGGKLADASAAIWKKLASTLDRKLLADYLEMQDVCMRMELTGIIVDPAELDRAEAAFADIEKELETEIYALAKHTFNINSGKQLGNVLYEELALPIASKTKTGWSTSIEALERIEHAHPIVALVLRWRALRRLRDNWVISLRRCIDADGRVHSRFNPARSFSGQIVNSNPDLGRVPGRTPEMARIRRAFVAAPGRLLMSVDFNQLGLHLLAHLTKDPALVGPLRARADMHRLTASAVLEIPPEQVTLEQRQLGKVVNFATFAGQGASALALQLGITAAEAKEYIARFDRHYAKVRAFQDEQLRLAREVGYITTIAGRKWPIGGLESLDNQVRSYAERLARRATHEASVQDVSRRALLEADRAIRREKLGALPVLQVLDEVLFDVPESELERAARVCADAMKNAYALEVPLVVGVEAGKTWADLGPVSL
jgi:DNA polymerase-1